MVGSTFHAPQLDINIKDHKPAYSLVTAPDFFPNVDQGELMDWAHTSGISKLVDPVWSDNLDPLSDERISPNLELNNPSNVHFPFSNDDDSVTAIVSLPIKDRIQTTFSPQTEQTMRHAYLPDGSFRSICSWLGCKFGCFQRRRSLGVIRPWQSFS